MVEQKMTDPRIRICECGKRCYSTPTRARKAMAKARNRVRVYWCEVGHCYHVTATKNS